MVKSSVMDKRSKQFSDRLRSEYCAAPEARDVLTAEAELGTGAIAFQLKPEGRRLLLRALDLERKAKMRAERGGA